MLVRNTEIVFLIYLPFDVSSLKMEDFPVNSKLHKMSVLFVKEQTNSVRVAAKHQLIFSHFFLPIFVNADKKAVMLHRKMNKTTVGLSIAQ